MPLDKSIKKVLVIGSGPIVIGQAAEFDYAGTQACKVLREDGIEIVLINSNPATIMTDKSTADRIYIEPLTLDTVKRIIEVEKPDSILSGLGGQTGLNLCMRLAKDGFLAKHNVRLLGSSPEAIDKSEDRLLFKQTMQSIGQPCIPSVVANDLKTALEFAKKEGFPLIIRPAFTLGGSGGGIVNDEKEFRETAANGLALSPITQILVEKSVAGWKEIEFEVMRDKAGNAIAICSMENFDPVGVHTGDSIVIAPAVTLSSKEYSMLRAAALNIIEALGIEGGCNCQFALDPNSFDYAVIEVNPRVSRSSALASKATGYPIAKTATKIAIGYTLDEILNSVTGCTYSAFEPSIDYVAVKFPKWAFDKFVYAKKELGTQMKATGEVMAIADTFEQAIMKAVRGAEIGVDTLSITRLKNKTDEKILSYLKQQPTDERIFVLYEALKREIATIDEIYEWTKVDRWFLKKLQNIAACENELIKNPLSHELYLKAKRYGFTNRAIGVISNEPVPYHNTPLYKTVDTCAGEFEAATPYFYSICGIDDNGGECEAEAFVKKSTKPRIVVLGSGPIRIGQGIEFDYASVHCVRALKNAGYEVIVINNNPETVSTDFDIADRLYFEPLFIEDVLDIIMLENPIGVIAAFGGGTAIKLTKALHKKGVNIIGTSADSIDMCEERQRFEDLLENLDIKRPKGSTADTTDEALAIAHDLGYPVLMRPSYVLGGQNMIIAFTDEDIKEYMEIIMRSKDGRVLIDKYLSGLEMELDAISDGEDVLIPGIMEHIERTGIHSGDSIAVYPAVHVDDNMAQKILEITKNICVALKVKGLVNIQLVEYENEIYIIEVNPRASRTVPYISKVTNIPICELATRAALGESLSSLGYGQGIAKMSPYTAVKVPVFSFEKLTGVDTHLGPEMKSTGEVLGIGKNLQEALYKGLIAAGYKLNKPSKGGVFITVRNSDKDEITETANKYKKLGCTLYATEGTAKILAASGLKVNAVGKIHENPDNNIMTLLESGKINYIISTSKKGRDPARDSVKMRRKACLLGIPCLTSIDTANAVADSILSGYTEHTTEIVNVNELRSGQLKLKFIKMQGTGNDYIYMDCLDTAIDYPESLAVILSERHYGIGGDGLVLIKRSAVADARMQMFNADGTEGKMCGNAIRCVAKYLFDNNIVSKRNMTIETKCGIKEVEVFTHNGLVSKAKVKMGKPVFEPEQIPTTIKGEKGKIVRQKIDVDGQSYTVTCLSMGNPHCVVICDDIDNIDLGDIGAKFKQSEYFPEGVNIEFVKVIGRNTIKMRIYERGTGETLSCGTCACAAAIASVLGGHCDKDADIRVKVPGGDLVINYSDEAVYLTGDCTKTFEGTVLV